MVLSLNGASKNKVEKTSLNYLWFWLKLYETIEHNEISSLVEI